MNFLTALLPALCMLSLLEAGKNKKYKLSAKRIEAGKYERRCEKDDLNVLVLDEAEEIKEVAEVMLKYNTPIVWIGGIKGVEYDGAFLLSVDAKKKKSKYGGHSFTLVPAQKLKDFSGEYFALCRRNSEE